MLPFSAFTIDLRTVIYLAVFLFDISIYNLVVISVN